MFATTFPSPLHFAGASVDAHGDNVCELAIDPLCDRNWDEKVLAHPASTFFHSAAWAKVICKTYGHQPMYRSYSSEGKTVAVIPMIEIKSVITGCRGVSLPFSDSCEPLVFDRSYAPDVLRRVTQMSRERRWKYFETRGMPLENGQSPVAGFHGHILDLRNGPDAVFSGFSSSVRRAIRKGERSGVTVRVSKEREDIVAYYRLHTETRRRHGAPPQPLSFFLNLHAEAIANGLGFVVLACKGTKPIAGAVCLQFGRKAIYKFGALDLASQELRGSNIVIWEAIKLLCASGCETLDFGRTDLSDESLRRFKAGWGTKEKRIDYFRHSSAGGRSIAGRKPISELQMALFRRLPLALNRWAGTALYPHLD